MNFDEQLMQQALVCAQKALDEGEIPVGAIVVSPYGEVVGHGWNLVEQQTTQALHAEMVAMRMAAEAIKDWRLTGCTLYVTLEPCLMCYGMAVISRIERIVYGANSPLYGYRLDSDDEHQLYTKQIKNVMAGVGAQEAQELLKEFFNKKRNEYDADKS